MSPDVIVDDLATTVGNTGAAHMGLLIASVMEQAKPGQRLAVVSVADGCDVVIAETTDALGSVQPRHTLAAQIPGSRPLTSYETFLTWRGHLDREPPRRPDPTSPAAPPSLRNEEWKFGFVGGRVRGMRGARTCRLPGCAPGVTPSTR